MGEWVSLHGTDAHLHGASSLLLNRMGDLAHISGVQCRERVEREKRAPETGVRWECGLRTGNA